MTDLPLPPDSDLTAAEAEELMLLCGHAPGPEPLSPAARAVLNAYYEVDTTEEDGLVAALRATAEHIDDASDGLECQDILRRIADELDGACLLTT